MMVLIAGDLQEMKPIGKYVVESQIQFGQTDGGLAKLRAMHMPVALHMTSTLIIHVLCIVVREARARQ
jgi:hypothetical protein